MHAYEQVARTLEDEIQRGIWPAGTALPTIPELESRFGLSSVTIRNGLRELTARGLIVTGYLDGKRGTIVRSRRLVPQLATGSMREQADRALTGSEEALVETFTMRIEAAPAYIAKRLGVGQDDLVIQRDLVQTLEGQPWGRECSYYPRDIAEAAGLDTPHNIRTGALPELDAAGFGEIATIDELSPLTKAGAADAAAMGVEIGTPLIVVTRTGATDKRVTRVTVFTRMAEEQRLVWELGDDRGIGVIRRVMLDPAAAPIGTGVGSAA